MRALQLTQVRPQQAIYTAQDTGLNISTMINAIMPIIMLALMFKMIVPMMTGLTEKD